MAESKELAVAEGNKQEKQFKADQQKPLDTPRTREACRRLGLVPEDLQIRSFESFYIPGDLKEKHQLRFEHYEKKRKERFSQVLAERAKVIAENAKKGDLPGAQSAQFLSMLESLFEKEAKRMEIDMKGQLRQHSSLVKENEEQIRKEGQLQEKMVQVDKKREIVMQKQDERGKMSRELLDKKILQNKELMQKLEKEHEQKQANYAKEMLAEEERIQRFAEERKVMNLEKTAVFRERVAQMKEKTELLQEERRLEGEKRLQDIEVRIDNVSRRREEEQKQRQLRSEEQHLHLMDVREAKSRIDRVDGYRRQELRDQIHTSTFRTSAKEDDLTSPFSSKQALSPGSGYWCSSGRHDPEQVVVWTGIMHKRRKVRSLKVSWAYAPGQVRVRSTADGRHWETAVPWHQSKEGGVSFQEDMNFDRPRNSMQIKIEMKQPKEWGYYGINQASLELA